MSWKMIVVLLTAFGCGIAAERAHATMQAQPLAPDVSVVAPDEYHIEFENDYVRVARVKSPPHVKVPMHSHPPPGGVIVTLTDQDSRVTGRDGSSREIHYKPGQVRWAVSTPGADLSTQSAHIEENLSDKPLEVIRIDVKPATSSQPGLPNVVMPLDQMKWTTVPDGTGRQTADLFGDRQKAELFGYLVKWPKNTFAKAHSHPENRYGMVLSGTFYHGHGRAFVANALERRGQGTYFSEPAGDAHFGATRDEETVLYFVGIGPDRTDDIEK
jgi:quercetin dioxygenase-like cupin family protein